MNTAAEILAPQLKATQQAATQLRQLTSEQKSQLLHQLAEALLVAQPDILAANEKDLAEMPTTDAKYDRLKLTPQRLADLAAAVHQVADLPDPSDQLLWQQTLPNDLLLEKWAVPMGVIGVIYESRPNVTIDVAALCLRSGNACVLKGGKEAHRSNEALVKVIHRVLEAAQLPTALVLLLPPDRTYTDALLKARHYVDLLIPRGSDSLIQYVRQHALIPTIETGAGVCHIYVEQTADLPRAAAIVVNARASRPSVCNSCDCVLIDAAILPTFAQELQAAAVPYNIELYADEAAHAVLAAQGYPKLQAATPDDFGREWLDYKLSVKTVNGMAEALEHIQQYSSKHSEAILTTNEALATKFLKEVDAAAVYHNASTRFTDGGVFGLGAEIGISTQKLHARGPFALEKLVTEKWVVRGNGQTRW